MTRRSHVMLAATMVIAAAVGARSAQLVLPTAPLAMRAFTLQFHPAGTFSLAGPEWPSMSGTWTTSGNGVTLQNQSGPPSCAEPGRYTFAIEGAGVSFAVVADTCEPRRMILDRSQWMPPGAAPPPAARTIVRTAGPRKRRCRARASPQGRGRRSAVPRRRAVADGSTCRIVGVPRAARTSCGARRFLDWPTRAPSCGAISCS